MLHLVTDELHVIILPKHGHFIVDAAAAAAAAVVVTVVVVNWIALVPSSDITSICTSLVTC